MSGLSVDPAVGLPSGHPVLGSVHDGVQLPYALNLGAASSAHLVLTFDGVTAADVPSGSATGTLRVPAGHAALQRDDEVQVVLTATDAAGTVLARAATVGSVADGALVPATVRAFNPDASDLAAGQTLWVTEGQTVRFQSQVASGAAHVAVIAYALTVDGVGILDDPTVSRQAVQWVSGTWTAPTGAGNHTLTYSASVDGDTSTQTRTFTLAVQPTGTITLDSSSMSADVGGPVAVSGRFQVSTTYAAVAGAPVQIWWKDTTATSDWTLVTTATTDAQGRFSAPVSPTASGSYQVRAAAVPGTVGSTWSGPMAVAVQARVVLRVDRQSAATGTQLTFTIQAPPPMAGVTGMLQLWNGLYWTTVAHQPLDAGGASTLHYTVTETGSHRFGAFTGYSATYAPTASDDLTVTVR